ncbi:MAG: B12-binding domain-containing protein [Microthrixaceae bacterium]
MTPRTTPDDAPLGLREAAERLGVHYMTAYRYVRSGRLPATKVGDEWRVDPDDVAHFRRDAAASSARSTGAAAPAAAPGPARRSAHRDRLEARLLAGDEAGAWGVVETAMAGGAEPSEVLTELLSPAMHHIGERWAAGELPIAEEHRASAVANRLIGRLGPRFARPGRRRGTVVLGSVAGDRHSLPTAILSDLLRGAGFDVMDLGADTPPESFVDAGRQAGRLAAVGLCVSAPDVLDDVAAQVDEVRDGLPGVPVLVGGGAVADEAVARALGSDGFAADPAAAVELFASCAAGRVG